MKQNRGSKEQICTHMDNCFMEKVTKYFNGEKESLFKKTVLEQVDKHFGRENKL